MYKLLVVDDEKMIRMGTKMELTGKKSGLMKFLLRLRRGKRWK